MQTFQQRHVLSYGGNFRHNIFDLSIAPQGDNRTEGGAYAQDEIFLGKYFRWLARRAARQVRHHLGRAVLAADDADVQADRRIRRSACRSTARTARRR